MTSSLHQTSVPQLPHTSFEEMRLCSHQCRRIFWVIGKCGIKPRYPDFKECVPTTCMGYWRKLKILGQKCERLLIVHKVDYCLLIDETQSITSYILIFIRKIIINWFLDVYIWLLTNNTSLSCMNPINMGSKNKLLYQLLYL